MCIFIGVPSDDKIEVPRRLDLSPERQRLTRFGAIKYRQILRWVAVVINGIRRSKGVWQSGIDILHERISEDVFEPFLYGLDLFKWECEFHGSLIALGEGANSAIGECLNHP